MAKTDAKSLTTLQERLSLVERDLLAVAAWLKGVDADEGKAAIDTVLRSLVRTAEAARAVWSACPHCNSPAGQRDLEKVNQFSGVFMIPQCDACRPLAELILGIEKLGRAGQRK